MNRPLPSHPLDLKEVMVSVRALPALPEVVFRLIQSLDDPNLDLAQLEALVTMDQALVAKVLRIANSSFYGLLRQVGTVRDAAMVMGFGALRNLAIATATINHFSSLRLPPDFTYRDFWAHGMACALAAEWLALECREPEGVAFTAGLLHDMGRLVLASDYPAHYAACRQYKVTHGCGLIEAEQAVLGLTHPTIGAAMARHWHFPLLVADAIEHHHQPDRAQTPLAHLVHLADGLVREQVRLGEDGEVTLGPYLSHASWALHGPAPQALERLRHTLQERLHAIDELIGHGQEAHR